MSRFPAIVFDRNLVMAVYEGAEDLLEGLTGEELDDVATDAMKSDALWDSLHEAVSEALQTIRINRA